jgi:exopolyphosphatase / guanosine-5'-triphosphate,3'-diphosphate pyrophosphatase
VAVDTFAAINVGSFELELGIYEISARSGIRQIDRMRHVISLGSETYKNGKISYGMVEELCQVLGDFSAVMKTYRVKDYRAYATSAMREARNSQIVIDQIRVRTGIEVRIISNSEQRFLSYKAVASRDAEFDKNIRSGTAIVDVSFGSMQISLFDKNLLISTQNLPLGVLRIRGLLSPVRTTLEKNRELIAEMVDNELFNYKKMYLKDRQIQHVIGIGEIILYMFRFENRGAAMERVSREEFDAFYERLSRMSESEIEEHFGVNSEYAALLMPGAIIYKKIMELSGAEMLWIPGIRLCDGIAAEYAMDSKKLRLKHNFDNDIITASRNMAKRYRCQSSHAEAVEKYALEIFDVMKKYHGMGARERLLLQIAVILHACGKFISVKNSNECAYNIIMSTEIIGISHPERVMIADIVRYNIRDFDYNMVREETGMAENRDATILTAKLTAILRLANSMDRGHRQKLKNCRITVKNGKLIVSTEYPGDITLEAMSFEQKAEFFEEIFGIRPVLKQKRSV